MLCLEFKLRAMFNSNGQDQFQHRPEKHSRQLGWLNQQEERELDVLLQLAIGLSQYIRFFVAIYLNQSRPLDSLKRIEALVTIAIP